MSFADKGIDYLDQHKIGLGKMLVMLVCTGGIVLGVFTWHADAEDSHEPLLTRKEYRIEKLDDDIGAKQVARSSAKIEQIKASDTETKAEIAAYEELLSCEIQQDRKVRACVAENGEDCYVLRQDCSPVEHP